MTFDAEGYERDVVKPRRSSGRLPDDLLTRYGMDMPLSGAPLASHLKAVRAYWNRKSGGIGNLAQLCKALRAADDMLQRKHDLSEPDFWVKAARQREERAADLVAELAADLKRRFSGVITRQQIDGLSGRYQALSAEQRLTAVGQAQLRVVTPLELPVECGLTGIQLAELASSLANCGHKTVVDLLIPNVRTPFRLLDGLKVPGSPSLKLNKALVTAARDEVQAIGNTAYEQARRNAVRIIAPAVAGGADPNRIAVAHIVHVLAGDGVRRPEFTASEAKDLGLHADDAETLALTVDAHRPAHETVGPQDVTRLLSEGKLQAARQALLSITGTPDGLTEAKAAVDTARREVDSLLEQAARADGPRVEQLLRQAAEIAADDDTIATMLVRLPPPAVADLGAAFTGAADSTRVNLRWGIPLNGFDDLVYRVVRTVAVDPHGPGDGELIGDSQVLQAVDANPRPGPDIRYTVFVTAADPADPHAVWSAPVTVTVAVVPPVGAARAADTGDAVELSWRVHPAASRVNVRRRLGAPPTHARDGESVPAAVDGCVDETGPTGQRRYYSLTAVYPGGPDGTELTAEPVFVEATSYERAAALVEWTAEPVLDHGTVKVRLSWPATAGEIRMYRSDRVPAADPGTLLSASALNRVGAPVPGSGRVRGDEVELVVPHQTSRPVYVPATVVADAGVIGRARRIEILPAVTGLTCERRGAGLLVSWVWPNDTAQAEVTPVPDGTPRRITKSRYVAEGGCLLSADPGITGVEVRTMTSRSGQTNLSPAATARLDAVATTVRYRVERAPRTGLLPDRRRWRVTIVTETPCPDTELLVVAAPGTIMPTRPDPDRVLHRRRLDSPEAETFVDVTVPPELGKRYWLRCFLAGNTAARIQDPPLSSLKVG